MKSLKPFWWLKLAAGLFLLVAGIYAAYWWFYKLAPWRCTCSPQWVRTHSTLECWREVQKGIHRVGWSHDNGFTVGSYGDKAWMEWIINHIKPGDHLDGCYGDGPSHADGALRAISNQNVGKEASAWIDWWEKNKSKTQEQWIADGFQLRGYEIEMPPTKEQYPRLLELLGSSEAEDGSIPPHVEYNAFRCLRDTGFEPVAYAIANRTLSPGNERGLLRYADMERRWPAADGVGHLSFAKDDDFWEGPLPYMLQPRGRIMANVLVFGPLLLGAGLIIWSLRKKKEADTPGGCVPVGG